MGILINIEDLLSGKMVEKSRVELKEQWEPQSILRSICAFANDFENEGSGYIIIGLKEIKGKPVRPVEGFNPADFEKVQKELLEYCKLITPVYIPKIALEKVDKKHVLVIWVPGGSNRPYGVPDDIKARYKSYNYRIRRGSRSVVPNEEEWLELIQLTAKTPFDDRAGFSACMEDLDISLMQEHLKKTKSSLFYSSPSMTIEDLAEKMNLLQHGNDKIYPKNIALLMFSNNPEKFIPGAYIDLVEFPEGIAGKEFNEKSFKGPIQKQLTEVLSYFNTNTLKNKVIKYEDKEESSMVFNYPFSAIEEALSNAVYHKNYDSQQPIEIRVLPESIEIISYNGAHSSLKQIDFEEGLVRARRYRNRRIGEFLKELRLTEGRGTGVSTINRALKANGSGVAKFDTNEPERAYFIVELPIHPAFKAKKIPIPLHDNQETIQEATQEDPRLEVPEKSNKRISLSFQELLNKVEEFEVSIENEIIEIEEDQIKKFAHLAAFLNNEQAKILGYSKSPKKRSEILEECLGITNQTKNFDRHLAPILKLNLLQRTYPEKKKSKLQKYVTTPAGKIVWYIKVNKK